MTEKYTITSYHLDHYSPKQTKKDQMLSQSMQLLLPITSRNPTGPITPEEKKQDSPVLLKNSNRSKQ
jgi:hypothetical protein